MSSGVRLSGTNFGGAGCGATLIEHLASPVSAIQNSIPACRSAFRILRWVAGLQSSHCPQQLSTRRTVGMDIIAFAASSSGPHDSRAQAERIWSGLNGMTLTPPSRTSTSLQTSSVPTLRTSAQSAAGGTLYRATQGFEGVSFSDCCKRVGKPRSFSQQPCPGRYGHAHAIPSIRKAWRLVSIWHGQKDNLLRLHHLSPLLSARSIVLTLTFAR